MIWWQRSYSTVHLQSILQSESFPFRIGLMPRQRAVKVRCPICRTPVKSADREFPFCSERCRTIDLGKWASGAYVIPSPVHDGEEPIREANPENTEDES
jgi:endogenous inhibitor of DNA gyrase (YacG/DUF329 family)